MSKDDEVNSENHSKHNDQSLSSPESKEVNSSDNGNAFDRLPPEVRREITTSFAHFQAIPSAHNHPVLDKLDGDHIHKVLDISEKESSRTYQDASQKRLFTAFYAILGVATLGFLIVFLTDRDAELLKEIIKTIALLFGGFGAGYGYKTYKTMK